MNPRLTTLGPHRPLTLRRLLQAIHRDEAGTVTLETVLILAAIAMPVLIITIKFGWPKIKDYFDKGMDGLKDASDGAINGR